MMVRNWLRRRITSVPKTVLHSLDLLQWNLLRSAARLDIQIVDIGKLGTFIGTKARDHRNLLVAFAPTVRPLPIHRVSMSSLAKWSLQPVVR